MTFNYSYAEFLGKELQRQRMEEAERERLIRRLAVANPSYLRKVWYIFRSRWQREDRRISSREIFPPLSPLTKETPSN